MGTALDGEALSWWNEVSGDLSVQWSFEEAVATLHKRFISRAASAVAARRFQNVRYSSDLDKGVQSLHTDLVRAARQMFEHPGAYQLKLKFMQKLPKVISHAMVLTRGLSAEGHTLETLKNEAIRAETQLRVASNFGIISDIHSGAASGVIRNDQKWLSNTTKTQPSDSKFAASKTSNTRPAKAPEKPVSPGQSYDKSSPNAGQRRTVKCYNCGGDHFARDCKKPRMRSEVPPVRAMMLDINADQTDSPPVETLEDDAKSVQSTGSQELGNDIDRYESRSELDPEFEPEEEFLEDEQYDTYPGAIEFGAMTVDWTAMKEKKKKAKVPYKGEGRDKNVYLSSVRTKNSSTQPDRRRHARATVAACIDINGHKAWALLDTGSNAEMVSPDFARVNRLSVFELEEKVALQLGTKGSGSTINHGTNCEIVIGNYKSVQYLDVVNIQKYDIILGLPFMREHKMWIDLENHRFRIGGEWHQAMDTEDQAEYLVGTRNAPKGIPATATSSMPRRPVKQSQTSTARATAGSSQPPKDE